MRIHFLPLFIIFLMIGTVTTTYLLSTAAFRDSSYWLPTISETGDDSPQSSIFTAGLVFTSFGFIICVTVQFLNNKRLLLLYLDGPLRYFLRLNLATLVLGAICAINLVLVGSFQSHVGPPYGTNITCSTSAPADTHFAAAVPIGTCAPIPQYTAPVHYTNAVLLFGLQFIYISIVTRLQYLLAPFTGHSKRLLRAKLLFSVLNGIALFMMTLFAALYKFGVHDALWSTVAAFEYSTAVTIMLYWSTMYYDFKNIHFVLAVRADDEALPLVIKDVN